MNCKNFRKLIWLINYSDVANSLGEESALIYAII